MKRIRILINFTLLGLILTMFSCTSRTVTQIKLNGDKVVITRIDSTGGDVNGIRTVIFRGAITEEKPTGYVFVNHKHLLDGFEALLEYKDDKVVLLQPYHYFNYSGDSSQIQIKTIEDSIFYAIFFDKKQSQYLRIENALD